MAVAFVIAQGRKGSNPGRATSEPKSASPVLREARTKCQAAPGMKMPPLISPEALLQVAFSWQLQALILAAWRFFGDSVRSRRTDLDG